MIRFEDQVQRATPRSINVYQSIAALRFARPASSSSVFPTTTSSIRGTTTKVAPRAPSAKSVRRYNPRTGGTAREEDFVGYMQNLGLPHPKQLAAALPANLRAGEPQGDGRRPAAVGGRRSRRMEASARSLPSGSHAIAARSTCWMSARARRATVSSARWARWRELKTSRSTSCARGW
jgi:hypothetical protein